MLNVHRDITVSVDSVIDRFAKSKKQFLDFGYLLCQDLTCSSTTLKVAYLS